MLRRFTAATGRQPPHAAPWQFGPWIQPQGGTEQQLELLDELHAADVPLSVAQTYLHYFPCGDQQGNREAERARTAGVHDRGLAITTYFNPMVCTSYTDVYDPAAAADGLVEDMSGDPYTYQYSTDTSFEVSQFDFSSDAGKAGFSSVVDEAIEDGHDGWMEDFGEYTPLDSMTAAGVPGTRLHNVYPREYHCAAFDAVADAGRPIVRFQRSGWKGVAPCAMVVWGGDPTTGWGFDGLESSVRQSLTMGLSGISNWGSDIGGFFAIGAQALSPEMLTRWVQFGAVSGVMRTQANGIAIPSKPRPQVWDPDQIDNWRRYAKLRTQLYPYLAAADREYVRSGMPLVRHLALAYPGDDDAVAADDEFLFGPDLLAAPVTAPGITERSVYLPKGRWIHLWDALGYQDGNGSLKMRAAKAVKGSRSLTVPAPLDELPLLARAGTILPLLPPRVDTLADDYEYAESTSLAEGSRKLVLLAFPRGKSKAPFFEGERVKSKVRSKRERWILKVGGDVERTYALQASLATLADKLVPCRVKVDGERLRRQHWDFRKGTEVLTLDLRGRSPRLVVEGRC